MSQDLNDGRLVQNSKEQAWDMAKTLTLGRSGRSLAFDFQYSPEAGSIQHAREQRQRL